MPACLFGRDDHARVAFMDTETTAATPTPLLRYHLSNHLGTACLELDVNADVISYEEYYPFGSTSFQCGPDADTISLKRYRYTGKERDEETGLYYHGARYYAPWLARWCAVDPLESKFSPTSSYNYGNNNPIKLKDPNGKAVTGLDNILNSPLFEKTAARLQASSAFTNFLDEFANEKGSRSWINVDVKVFGNNDYIPAHGGKEKLDSDKFGYTQVLYKGVDIKDLSQNQLAGIKPENLQIQIGIRKNMSSESDKLGTILHEFGAHLSHLAGMLEKVKEGKITMSDFQKDYASESVHLEIHYGLNSTYTNIIKNVVATLANQDSLNPQEQVKTESEIEADKLNGIRLSDLGPEFKPGSNLFYLKNGKLEISESVFSQENYERNVQYNPYHVANTLQSVDPALIKNMEERVQQRENINNH